MGLEVLLVAQVDVGANEQAITELASQEKELLIGHSRPALLVGGADQVSPQPLAQRDWCSLIQQDIH